MATPTGTRNTERYVENLQLLADVHGECVGQGRGRSRKRADEHVVRARAVEQLLRRNAALVQYWVQRSRWKGVVADEELYAAGMIGLLRAIEKYDPQMGTTLATYAAWWIRQAIDREAQREERNRHVPLEYEDGSGRDVCDLGVDVEADALAVVAGGEVRNLVLFRIDALDEPERSTLRMWMALDGDQRAVAAALNVRESTVRYRIDAAISRVCHPSRAPVAERAQDWMERASCRGSDVDFFPTRGTRMEKAVSLCETCPVVDDCREVAINHTRLVGVWGGLSERGRRTLRQERRGGR